MDVRLPNGTVVRNVPENITKAELLAKLKANGMDVSGFNQSEPSYDPTEGMSGTQKFLAGVGKAFTDVGRGAGQLVGLVSREDVEQARKLDAPLMKTGAGTAGNILGNVVAAAPTAFIPGVNTIAGSAAVGAGMGLLQPSTSTGETIQNIATGGAAGAAVPALLTAGKVAKSFVEPLYQSGRNQIMGRALRQAAGGQADDAMRAMQQSKSAVPGVQYTAAEAAQNPGIAAMQRTATAVDPVAMNELAARQAANNAARIQALEEIAGTQGKRAFFEANRDATANALYEAARKQGINPAALTPEAQANMAAFQQRIPDEIMSRAKELAKLQGVNMDNESAVQGLHWVKRAIDSKIGTAARAGDNELVRAYTSLKNDLLAGLDQLSPQYGEARRTFAAMSKPITEMDVGAEIASRSINKLTGNIQPSAYARALQDQTAATVTGMPKATLQTTMTPESIATLNAIKDDLVRQNFAQTAGRGVGSDTVQKLAFSNMLDAAGIPSAIRSFAPASVVGNVAQRFGQIAYKDANEKMAAQLAQALLDPQSASALMSAGMVTPQMQALANSLRSGGAALGASVPGLIQANQQ